MSGRCIGVRFFKNSYIEVKHLGNYVLERLKFELFTMIILVDDFFVIYCDISSRVLSKVIQNMSILFIKSCCYLFHSNTFSN